MIISFLKLLYDVTLSEKTVKHIRLLIDENMKSTDENMKHIRLLVDENMKRIDENTKGIGLLTS